MLPTTLKFLSPVSITSFFAVVTPLEFINRIVRNPFYTGIKFLSFKYSRLLHPHGPQLFSYQLEST